jgi:arylformamidase
MEILDITLPLSNQTPVWVGDKGVTIQQVAFRERASDFNISRVEFGVHAGTHIDSPFHLSTQGYTVDKIPLDTLVGPATVLAIPPEFNVINSKALSSSGFKSGMDRIILKTHNTRFWVDDPTVFHGDFIGINSEGADFLVHQGVKLVGIDYFSASPISDLVRPHEILLGAGVVILENAYLVDVNPGDYDLICLPLKLIGTDGAPVRAILTPRKIQS